MDHGTIELVCIAVIAFAVLLQTIILLAVFVGLGKTAKLIKEELEVMRSSVLPALKNTSEVLARVSPKLESTVNDVSELARMMRKQAADAEVSVEQVLETVRRQTGRVDSMMTSALDALDRASDFATKAVGKPARQISGLLAGIRAAIETLSSGSVDRRRNGSEDDKDMFI
jgi:uncharacterized protein YoxC